MSKRLLWGNEKDIAQLVTLLMNEKVSICTTDTVLGLLVPTTKKGFERLNSIKNRYEKPYLILIPSKKYVAHFVDLQDKKLKELIDNVWPGPVTLIFKAKESVPEFMKSQQGTIALRVPDHQGLQAVMEKVGPLFSTSANITGELIPTRVEDVSAEIMNNVTAVVSDGKHSKEALPSTILDCTDPENIKVVRQGYFIKSEKLKKF